MLSSRPTADHRRYNQLSRQSQYPTSLNLDSRPANSSTTTPSSSQPLYAAGQQPQLTGLDTSAVAVPRTAQTTGIEDISGCLNQPPDLMPSEPWAMASSQYMPKSIGRMPHQRESSLSSLGSAGPESPFNRNTTNPHIAMSDPASDGFGDMHAQDAGNSYYQLNKAMAAPDSMYPGYHNVNNLDHPEMGYPSAIALHRPRSDKEGLLPTPDFGAAHGRSHPPSVASSTVGGDSPATPSLGEPPEEDKRRKTGFAEPPKLDRTMTDIYSDELYNPSFTITSASPSQPQMAVSPTNDIFAQRLSAANSQHLSAGQSPASSASRDRSPFCHGSPLAPPAVRNDNGQALPAPHMRFNSAHQMREQEKAEEEARVLHQQVSTKVEPETPKTISPKDAMLEFNGAEADSNFPSLFPSQESADFGIEGLPKMNPSHGQMGLFQRSASHGGSNPAGLHYMTPQFHGGVQVPQQYPFIAHAPQQPPQHQVSPPRLSPVESSASSSANTPISMQKPKGAKTDGGTYTCTYHGCTLRFETPSLLQKHKREGHRQPQGLGTASPDRPESASPVSNSLFNSQAGPHRCDRINPSTGKSCNTIFSRPYDLTRHEDTIHNARKQKVRCNLCTEEKMFSRADALTRHYRVCHPDVEFPGKHRKRGQNS